MYVNVWVGSRERMDVTLLFSSFHYLGHSSTLWASARESSLLPRASSRPQLCIVSISSQSPPSSPGQMPSHSSALWASSWESSLLPRGSDKPQLYIVSIGSRETSLLPRGRAKQEMICLKCCQDWASEDELVLHVHKEAGLGQGPAPKESPGRLSDSPSWGFSQKGL